MTINIPHKYHNAIIGPKGRLVRSVMDECGVRIYFPPSGSKNDEVTVSGAPEDVERAKTILEEMASETALESHSLELKAKPEYHKFLIGRNGANIRKVCGAVCGWEGGGGVSSLFDSFRAADMYAQYTTHIMVFQTAAVIVFTSVWCVFVLHNMYCIMCGR